MAAPIRKEDEDIIKGGTLRLTWISAAAAGLAAFVTVFNDTFERMFGKDQPSIKAAILIAVIAAFTLISVSDLLARALATAAKLRSSAQKEVGSQAAAKLEAAAKTLSDKWESAQDGWAISAVPASLTATKTKGSDVSGFIVAATRYKRSDPDDSQWLLVKAGVELHDGPGRTTWEPRPD